jgi:predicted Zn-dependent protease with MMP-like domain
VDQIRETMMDHDEFVELVKSAVKGLPKFFRKRMENVSIVVEDLPSSEEANRVGAHQRSLLGLYQGVPLRQRSVWRDQAMPDKISIYQVNIEAVARTPEAIKALVQEVVAHEIGHYFGLNEEELRKAQGTGAESS